MLVRDQLIAQIAPTLPAEVEEVLRKFPEAQLTGSRYFGGYTEDSDFDFYVDGTTFDLSRGGWRRSMADIDYRNPHVDDVFVKGRVHLIVVKSNSWQIFKDAHILIGSRFFLGSLLQIQPSSSFSSLPKEVRKAIFRMALELCALKEKVDL